MEQLYDQFQRKIDYLRLSITDRCNLRCVYCMPEEGLKFFPKDKIMSQDEIIQLVQNFAKMGITKVRLTGGEPLLYKYHYYGGTYPRLSSVFGKFLKLTTFQLRRTGRP